MVRSNQAGALGTAVVSPIHLWDLTAVPQGGGTNTRYPAAFYECGFSTESSNGNVFWTTHVNGAATSAFGLDQTGTTFNYGYNPSQTYTTKTQNLTANANHEGPGANSILEKVKCTMVLNGPTARSTKWCIQLVQLSEAVTPGTELPSFTNEPTAFWQAMARPYGYSPLETGPRGELKSNIKILKTLEYIMDSPESSEDHLTSRMRHIDFSMYFNRKVNYRWGRNNDLTTMDTADIPIDATTQVFSSKPDPKARIYLMVRALCTYLGPNATPLNSLFPSYDIKLDITHKSSD
jgi:hypothetical protein